MSYEQKKHWYRPKVENSDFFFDVTEFSGRILCFMGAEQKGRSFPVFSSINVALEASKHGFMNVCGHEAKYKPTLSRKGPFKIIFGQIMFF